MNNTPFLRLNNGEVLNVGEVKKTIAGELTIERFSHGYDIANRTLFSFFLELNQNWLLFYNALQN